MRPLLTQQLLRFQIGRKSTVKQQCCFGSTMAPAPPLSTEKLIAKNFEEITVPVPWGHIAGKWYGPKHVRPLVGLHGWQDNAGTFDTLAPLLPPHISFLSLDMPGHGLSSWLPEGVPYHSIDYVALNLRLMDEFNWDKISILGHSMSSINGFVFASLFPSKIDMLIGLDTLKPLTRSHTTIVNHLAERLEGALKMEKRYRNHLEPPSYEWDELVDRLHLGTEKSINVETCKYILKRNTKFLPNDPQKYYFSRDSRLKMSLFYTFPREVILEMARRIRCPHMFIKALGGPYYEKKEHHDEAVLVLRENPLFEYYEVEGTHHVHLNDPQKIADIVNPFINKWRAL